MTMHPSIRLIQIAAPSLGYRVGEPDQWWGPKTEMGLQRLEADGPLKSSVWAITTFQRGLAGLGWLIGEPTGIWDDETVIGLRAVLTAKGKAFVSFDPTEPEDQDDEDFTEGRDIGSEGLPLVEDTVGRISQGGKTIWGICLHTTATPGDYLDNLTNAEAWRNVTGYHTRPVSQGGRGWRYNGYHEGVFWNGEVLRGRPSVTIMGAGASGYNVGVIHITMFPKVTITRMHDDPLDLYTEAQVMTVRKRIEYWARQTPITRIFGHNEVANKLCPGMPVVDSYWTRRDVA